MATRKTSSLHRQASRAPASTRRRVVIEGRCSIAGREAQDVLLTDLDPSGCRMRANAVGVTKSDPLELWLGENGPIAGRLKWSKAGAFGVSFETPIAQHLVDALCEASDNAKVVPLRR